MNTTTETTKKPITTDNTDAQTPKTITPKPVAIATLAKEPANPPKHLAIALTPELRERLNKIAEAEGVSTAAVVRRAVLAQIAGEDASTNAATAKADAVQVGLDAALAKLKQLDKAIDSALTDTVRIADRLARATADKG